MFSEFKVIPAGIGYSFVEPPAGLLPEISKRIRMYSDEEGNANANVYAAVFVLSCLHKDNQPVFSEIASTLPCCCECDSLTNKPLIIAETGRCLLVNEATTIRLAYCKLADDQFKAVVDEFIFNITKEKLQEWFDIVDNEILITKKATDKVKND